MTAQTWDEFAEENSGTVGDAVLFDIQRESQD